MTRGSRGMGLLFLLIGSGFFVLLGMGLERSTPLGMLDFKALYYGARCLTHHCDPYNFSQLQNFFLEDGGGHASDPPVIRELVGRYVNLPTTFIFTVPFTLLPWSLAHLLWTIITVGLFLLAAFLMWSLCANSAPVISGCMIGFLIANSEVLFAGGNAAGIVISFSVIAVWCFLKERFEPAGVVCLAISLVIKPHDVGLVWLYFLLAGGVYRKRALQTLVVTVALSLPAILWVSQVAPNWIQELHSNLSAISTHGGFNDPGPGTIIDRTPGMVIDVQAAVSIFRNDPRIYNAVSYLVGGPLLLLWSLRTLRSRSSLRSAWLALSAVAALTMLVTYHKPIDARLLVLSVPACVILWAEGGAAGTIALVVNAAAIVFTADIPLATLVLLTRNVHPDTTGLYGQMLTVLITRPASVILLVMAIFYLWVYLRRDPGQVRKSDSDGLDGPPSLSAPS